MTPIRLSTGHRSSPTLSPGGVLMLAFVCLIAAMLFAIHTAACLGWHGIEGAGWFALAGIGIVAKVVDELLALRASRLQP
jgi:hypothetical protein